MPHRVSTSKADGSGMIGTAPRSRSRALALGVALAFVAVGGQLVRLALLNEGSSTIRVSMMSTPSSTLARPDIVDRNGRLLATDVQMPSLYADPHLIQDADEAAERLGRMFSGLEVRALRSSLADKTKRFVWIRRGLTPAMAQRVHNLGIPGVLFVDEIRRTYPAGRLGGHVLGRVDIDNRGTSGIERHIDDVGASEAAHGARLSARAPVRLSLDLGVMHALDDELKSAMERYDAPGAAGLVMDVRTGEVVAAVSRPGADPAIAEEALDPERIDKVAAGTFELGSIVKLITVALALETGKSLDSLVDTSEPLKAGRFTIEDLHPLGRPMSVAEVFLHSSNVGAGQLALSAGAEAQTAFFQKLGLWSPLKTEVSAGPEPLKPAQVGRIEQITLAFGHGLAVTPLQFAAASAALMNGGTAVTPTFLARDDAVDGARVVSARTSALLRDVMRRNVTDPSGTGRRADAAGFEVGGKTGTAEMAARGGYRKKSVIASFLGTFPASDPRYVTLVMLFEPRGQESTGGEITAGRNAAPTTARVIERIAPLLGVAAKAS
ncbi:MAG: penicillin-binding protein 2 [Hyphomicrobium sp.]|nr:penicillin-binding protein 2 [Hyphomicrobium sp.]PPD09411.1 MAG: peptidoglycan glycosyltransferase [Hyphomicrobium sp.]